MKECQFQFVLNELRNKYRKNVFRFIYNATKDKYVLEHDSELPDVVIIEQIKKEFPRDDWDMFIVDKKNTEIIEDTRVWYLLKFANKPKMIVASDSYDRLKMYRENCYPSKKPVMAWCESWDDLLADKTYRGELEVI